MSHRRLVVAVVALVVAAAGPAAALTAHLITGTSGSGSLLDQTPGVDLRIGTSDDVLQTGAWGNLGYFQNDEKRAVRLYGKAGKAAGKSRLGVPLDAISAALDRLRPFIPGCA
jgi:hypothetical protein